MIHENKDQTEIINQLILLKGNKQKKKNEIIDFNVEDLFLKNNTIPHFLETKDKTDLEKEIKESFQEIKCVEFRQNFAKQEKILEKMKGYKRIYQINELIMSRPTKLIRIDSGKIQYAGFLIKIEFTECGTIIVCKGPNNVYYRFRMDQYLIYQKWNQTEEMLLNVKENMKL